MFSVESYARMFKRLLPPGRLWRLNPESILSKVFLGAAEELVRIDVRVEDLLRESDPTETSELLPDFERVLKLPSTGTEDERRARVVSLLVSRRRFRPVDFQNALAPILGQEIANVVVIERGRSFAIAVGDDQEIFRFFIYRDPTDPGSYSVADAQAQVDRMQPEHTKGQVIESIDFLCDDPFSLTDRDLLGA